MPAEPLIGIAVRSARRTTRLAEIQRSVALATGGEPGARLARRLAIPVSPDTLLRLILNWLRLCVAWFLAALMGSSAQSDTFNDPWKPIAA
jgi:hypothetical protein